MRGLILVAGALFVSVAAAELKYDMAKSDAGVCVARADDGSLYFGTYATPENPLCNAQRKTYPQLAAIANVFPKNVISMNTVDVSFLKTGWNSQGYKKPTDVWWTTNAQSMKPKEAGAKMAGTVEDNGSYKYAGARMSSWIGDVRSTEAYGFIGTASYLMLKGSVAANSMDFSLGTDPANVDARTTENICITWNAVTKTCGAKKTFSSGSYKYSLYGYVSGDKVEAAAAPYSDMMVTQEIKFFHNGVQQTVATGFKPKEVVTINGGVALSETAYNEVNTLEIKQKDGRTVKMDFVKKFLEGVHTGTTVNAAIKAETAMKVYANMEGDALRLHYVFPMSANGLKKKNGFFVYDPTMSGQAAGTTNTGTKEIKGSNAVVASVAVAALSLLL